MIRMTTVIAAFATICIAANCTPVEAAQPQPLVQSGLLHFDTPGQQAAEVTPVQYHRHCYYRHHRRYCHR